MRWAALAIGLALACASRRVHAEEDAGSKTVPELLEAAKQRADDGRLVDALRSGRDALALAIAAGDAGPIQTARVVVEDLLKRIPHVTFSAPNPAVTELRVAFDNRPVPVDSLSKTFSVDPGKHEVEAHGIREGRDYSYYETIDLPEGNEVTTVYLLLKQVESNPELFFPRQCMLDAKTEEELRYCIDPASRPRGCRACTTTPASPPRPSLERRPRALHDRGFESFIIRFTADSRSRRWKISYTRSRPSSIMKSTR